VFISIGSIIIDDIILPDGQSRMGLLGGGCTHAVMGMRVWSDQVGLVSAVGFDFPENLLAELTYRFDTRAVVLRQTRTPRAWQLFETDGTRNEVFRTNVHQMAEIAPHISEFPEKFVNISGVHLHSAAEEADRWIDFLQTRGNPLILWEPWDMICTPANSKSIYELARKVNVFSPGLREAQEITGAEDPIQIIRLFISQGIKAVALRMGADGSLVANSEGFLAAVGAVTTGPIVDVTGAGNAYCGGLIIGMAESGDLVLAGRMGSVAAAFSLGQFGALYKLEGVNQKARSLLPLCKSTQLS
jgi:sugar/nucleoside kinase (ribokinase family)